ncbi:sugar translocase [Halobacteriales archaeon QS_1_68_20]|nr:MAG: sugar translocase [Halobacteriales archaeon QS_1_68_20]
MTDGDGDDGVAADAGGDDGGTADEVAADGVGVEATPAGTLGELVSAVRFGKFASVGVVGAVFDNAVLAALTLGLGVHEMVAKAAGIETAIVVMFLVNERWTFADEGRPGRWPTVRRLARSHVVRSGGVAVQLVVYWVLTQQVSVTLEVFGADLWFLVASPVAIAVAMVVNYTAESLFTWRVHR